MIQFYCLPPNEPPKIWNSTKNKVIGKIPITVHEVLLTKLQFDSPVVETMSEQSIALSTAPKMKIAIIKPTATPMKPMTNARFNIFQNDL